MKHIIDLAHLPKYIKMIERGGYRTTSGGKAFGVPRQIFANWLNWGARDVARGTDSAYATVLQATEDAEQVYEANAHEMLDSSDDWRSVAWRLERRLRDTHGDTKRIELAPVAQLAATDDTVRALTADDVRALAEIAFAPEGNGESAK